MTNALVDTVSGDAEHSGLPAETEFLLNWMRAVQLAGPTYFGDGTLAGFRAANSKWDLCPNVELIESAIGVMSHGEKIFIAALVSVYDDVSGGDLLQQVGVHGLADFGLLDAQRRTLLANLIIHYNGW